MPKAAREGGHEIAAPAQYLDETRYSSANRRRLSAPGLRAFLAIADLWGLSEADRLRVLGFPGRSTYHGWVARARTGQDLVLGVDTLLRISAVLGIHKALRILFETDAEGTGWLREPHDAPTFGGEPPIALLTAGTQDALMQVRRYLDAMRGGIFAVPNEADRDFAPYRDDDIVFV
ncbi:MbcA/ParS/Xre antitoxin family protein [Arenibaculum pallidiluteum]|uniref:MbcA/ParS/Xre antitoxin family protein n=1 Tax=Arenibaculum pallidiluteum TaxID=2812559 RepID=UPI001A95DEAF|nr:MbcA/ParS/Xre antitoxin family protein [Arenibaculum pallidiluteum]